MTEDYFQNEMKKESLKEPKMISKFRWNKPLSIFHDLEFKGIDERDKYTPTKKDEWDAQVWNTQNYSRGPCYDYFVDYQQCATYVRSEFTISASCIKKFSNYCWKPYINFYHCMEQEVQHHPSSLIKGSKDPHAHH